MLKHVLRSEWDRKPRHLICRSSVSLSYIRLESDFFIDKLEDYNAFDTLIVREKRTRESLSWPSIEVKVLNYVILIHIIIKSKSLKIYSTNNNTNM